MCIVHALYFAPAFARLLIVFIWFDVPQLGPDNENHIRVGKLNLVDLAGSERQTKTGAKVSMQLTLYM